MMVVNEFVRKNLKTGVTSRSNFNAVQRGIFGILIASALLGMVACGSVGSGSAGNALVGASPSPTPTPTPSGRFKLMLRAYLPAADIVDGRYELPPVVEAKS